MGFAASPHHHKLLNNVSFLLSFLLTLYACPSGVGDDINQRAFWGAPYGAERL